jgi:hypothetical protein
MLAVSLYGDTSNSILEVSKTGELRAKNIANLTKAVNFIVKSGAAIVQFDR